MRIRAGLVLLLLSATAWAGSRGFPVARQNASGSDSSLFRAFPAEGSGVAYGAGLPYSTAGSFCTGPEFTAARAGATNYFCYEGDGDQVSSSAPYALSAVGSPTTVTRSVCPNGPDCGPMTGLRTNGLSSNCLKSASASSPTGSFSVIWVGRTDSTAGTQSLITKYTATPTDPTFGLQLLTGTQIILTVGKAASTTSNASSSGIIVPSAVHVVVATYQYVGDGTSIGKVYIDGVQSGSTNSTMVGPPMAGTQVFGMGCRADGSVPLSGTAYSAAFVDGVVLDATQVANITAALLPQATGAKGTRGETITTTRASVATCTAPRDSDGDGALDVSVLPNNRPCITCLASGACGLYTEPSGTQILAAGSHNFASGWTATRASLVLSTTQTGPDGTFLYKLVEDTTATNTHKVNQSITKAASALPYTLSVSGRAAERTKIIVQAVDSTASGSASTTCDLSAGTVSITGSTGTFSGASAYVQAAGSNTYRCVLAFTSNTDTTIRPEVYLVSGSGGSYTGDGTSGAYVSGANLESNGTALATSVMPASGRAATDHLGPLPAALSRTEGCARLTITPIWSGGNPIATSIWFLNASTTTTGRLAASGGSPNNQVSIVGNAAANVTANFAANAPQTYRTTWSATTGAVTSENVTAGTSGSNSGFTTLGAFDRGGIDIGSSTAGVNPPIGAVISNVVLGNSASGCQR